MNLLMSNIFLTENEKNKLHNYERHCEDDSIICEYLDPYWNDLLDNIPESISPNLITITGWLFLVYGFNIAYNFSDSYPSLSALLVFICSFMYTNCDCIDGKQARRTKTSSPLGEILDHLVDASGVTLLISSLCLVMGITNIRTIWLFCQAGHLVFLTEHVKAFNTGILKMNRYTGPVEILFFYCLMVLSISIFGQSMFSMIEYLNPIIIYIVASIYFLCNVAIICDTKKDTQKTLLFLYITKLLSTIVLYIFGIEPGILSVLSDGMLFVAVTTDTIISKLVKKDLSPLMMLIAMTSAVNEFFSLILCIGYVICLIYEISSHLGIPTVQRNVNVLCLGVFDMCHIGHMKMFEKASNLGTRLYVGVHSDEDVASYKAKPSVPHDLRCDTVKMCKYVYDAIPNAPLYMTTSDLVDKYNIHLVVCSPEYDKPDDKFYEYARKYGILKIVSRYDGISSTTIKENTVKNMIETQRINSINLIKKDDMELPENADADTVSVTVSGEVRKVFSSLKKRFTYII